MEPKKLDGKGKSAWVRAGEYSSLAFVLPSATFAGYAIGYLLDRAFGTNFLYLVFLLLGIVAGFVQVIRFAKRNQNGA